MKKLIVTLFVCCAALFAEDLGENNQNGFQNFKKDISTLEKSCEGGDDVICNILAAVEIDEVRAYNEYKAYQDSKRGCENGDDSRYCEYIGIQYANVNDNLKASEYFAKACDIGDALVCAKLGISYIIGDNQNAAKAYKYLQKGCDGGNGEACGFLGALYEELEERESGVKKDTNRALEYYKKACEMGYVKDCANYNRLKNE